MTENSGREERARRVLVTGGCGYIGSHVMRELAERGYTPVAYDNLSTGYREFVQGYELIEGDIRDEERLVASLDGIAAVMHFAAYIEVVESVLNPQKYFENNVAGSLTLLRAVLKSGVTNFIFSSSAAVYGAPLACPTPEDAPTQPTNPYGTSKLFVEQALSACSLAYGLRCVALRYFNAAGAHPGGSLVEVHRPETHLIPSLLLVAAGLRPEGVIFGTSHPTPDGTCIRDFIHVSDLAVAHVRALDFLLANGSSTVLNLGTGRGHSVREVVGMVEKVTGRNLSIRILPNRAGDPAVLVADPSRARQILEWEAGRSLEDTITSAWRALQANRSLFAEAAPNS